MYMYIYNIPYASIIYVYSAIDIHMMLYIHIYMMFLHSLGVC